MEEPSRQRQQRPPQPLPRGATAAAAAATGLPLLPLNDPEFTEFGIKIHKLRLTLKVSRRRASSASSTSSRRSSIAASDTSDLNTSTGQTPIRMRPRSQPRRPRVNSSASNLSDSLRLLDLDSNAGSRRPIGLATSPPPANYSGSGGGSRVANWEFQGFYSPPIRTSTPSSGYSSAAVSRTSSFSSEALSPAGRNPGRNSRITSTDDSVYSDVYSTIEELAEQPDPFDEEETKEKPKKKVAKVKSKQKAKAKKVDTPVVLPPTLPKMKATSKAKHQKTKSMTCLLDPPAPFDSGFSAAASAPSPLHKRTKSECVVDLTEPRAEPATVSRSAATSLELLALGIPPPLPPRASRCRPPARPPYPSSLVRAVQTITEPLDR